jgi:hypothetical protein
MATSHVASSLDRSPLGTPQMPQVANQDFHKHLLERRYSMKAKSLAPVRTQPGQPFDGYPAAAARGVLRLLSTSSLQALAPWTSAMDAASSNKTRACSAPL